MLRKSFGGGGSGPDNGGGGGGGGGEKLRFDDGMALVGKRIWVAGRGPARVRDFDKKKSWAGASNHFVVVELDASGEEPSTIVLLGDGDDGASELKRTDQQQHKKKKLLKPEPLILKRKGNEGVNWLVELSVEEVAAEGERASVANGI